MTAFPEDGYNFSMKLIMAIVACLLLAVIFYSVFYLYLKQYHFLNNTREKNHESTNKAHIENFTPQNIGETLSQKINDMKNFSLKNDVNMVSILSPIESKYIPAEFPINPDPIKASQYEFDIMNSYKSALQRQPSSEELKYKRYQFATGENDKENLLTELYNLPEYTRTANLQTNSPDIGLEHALYVKKMYFKLETFYTHFKGRSVPPKIMETLRNVYIHIQFNDYLLVSILLNNHYDSFEKEVLASYETINDVSTYVLFYKHFDLTEIKQKAVLLQEEDMKSDGSSNILSIKSKVLSDIFKNNIKTKPAPNTTENQDSSSSSSSISENILTTIENNKIFDKDKCAKNLDDNCRIYRPRRTPMPSLHPYNRAPVCTSLGHKQHTTVPLYPESKLLFNGTSVKTAYTDTQIGSIMPKFEYIEYVEKPAEDCQTCQNQKSQCPSIKK
jgi:hypothetical protein